MYETRNLAVFWIGDFELEFKLQTFKMADHIWRTTVARYNLICILLGIWAFFEAVISLFQHLTLCKIETLVVCQRLHLRSLEEQSRIFFLANTPWKHSRIPSLFMLKRFSYFKWWFFPNWDRFQEISHTITCAILFSRYFNSF